MFGLGTTEILIICFIVFLVFGAKRIPEMMKGLAQGIKELRSGVSIDEDTKKV